MCPNKPLMLNSAKPRPSSGTYRHASIMWKASSHMSATKFERDASMVCPCWPQVTHRARNIEAVQRKEHDSTCLQFVWDATTMDLHHDNKMPSYVVGCWEYTAMHPHVSQQTSHAKFCQRLHLTCLQQNLNVMLPWFALVGHKWPTGLGI